MLLVALVLACCFSSYSNADTTANLLDPSAQNWSGTYGTGYWAGTGGPAPNRLPHDAGFIWGSADSLVSTTIAINTALQQAGIQVNGFNYKWRIKNANTTSKTQTQVDPLKITVDVLKADGSVYASYEYDYGFRQGWSNRTGSETFTDNYLDPSFFGNINIGVRAKDADGSTGHYGPEFNTLRSEFNLTYSSNPCYSNALYDVACPGYATAYFNQQCTANPLYNSGCSGYAAAYLTQQCSSNPLYSTSCSGYSTAYYNQQCNLDALYDASCTGYTNAYYVQQCDYDPLYDVTCDGYADAYYKQQCTFNPQYDKNCEGYMAETPPGEIVIVEDPIVAEAITLETPIIPEREIVIEEVIIEETVVEEVIEEVIIVEPKQVDTAKAKSKKIKEIQQVATQSLADKMSTAASFEVQKQIQTQLINMISFVPNFSKYNKAKLYGGELQQEVNLKGGRIVDNAFARWFINDPNYERLEALQYNLKGN